ncbi:hypothetical protein [Salinimonas chungwhensis]|uniref:hypothetical protein n=1 Tax=Salinimonas chungwhensis TaxID=265425 RepID=UPI00037EA056|nr:hypothetical protein [Salinimonas chungwhensis]
MHLYLKFSIALSYFLIGGAAIAGYDEVCEVPEKTAAIAFWDFNKNESISLTNGAVRLGSRHSGIIKVPDTPYQGLRFRFEGKWPNGDSSSELRYKILQPQSHVWEYMRIYQPKNFYHRLIVEITPETALNPENWKFGDRIISDKGSTATVAKAFENRIFIEAPTSIYRKFWGEGRAIRNTNNDIQFFSKDSKFLGSNNKLSAMWQGKYSNAAMIVGTVGVSRDSGGAPGIGYCEALGSKSRDHGTFGTKSNKIHSFAPPICFDVADNGNVVEFVIERKRATNLENPDGVYTIWKRTATTDWHAIYHNNKIPAYQSENNHFDAGYIFGWSNSGFKEDTDFYLLSWGLWNERPNFL